MKEIMEAIFKDNQFKINNLPNNQGIDSFYAVSENSQKVNFYTVLFINDLFETDEGMIDFNAFYEDMKNAIGNYDHRMDKNLSMVICTKREVLDTKLYVSNKIYQIEEDPYFFKKYVL